MNNIELIETNCAALNKARAELRKKHEAKQREQRILDGRHNDGLRESQKQCAELRATIEALVEQARPDFLKPKQPKTRTFFGITVGFAKQQDKVVIPDEAVLVKNIESMLPAAQAKTLLNKTTLVIKDAFKKLDRATLQKLGCSIFTGTDKAVVRTADDDIETLVMKSLGDAKAES